jgi:hypothetical protein
MSVPVTRHILPGGNTITHCKRTYRNIFVLSVEVVVDLMVALNELLVHLAGVVAVVVLHAIDALREL